MWYPFGKDTTPPGERAYASRRLRDLPPTCSTERERAGVNMTNVEVREYADQLIKIIVQRELEADKRKLLEIAQAGAPRPRRTAKDLYQRRLALALYLSTTEVSGPTVERVTERYVDTLRAIERAKAKQRRSALSISPAKRRTCSSNR